MTAISTLSYLGRLTGGGSNAKIRIPLMEDWSFFVRKDGDDGNIGDVDSPDGAFKTFEHCWDVISSTLDFNGHSVSINMGTGVWTDSCAFYRPWVGGGSIYLYGNGVANTTISTVGQHCVEVSGNAMPGTIYVDQMKLTTVNNGFTSGIAVTGTGYVYVGAVEFGVCSHHMLINGLGWLYTIDAYTITGNANTHFLAQVAGSNIYIYGPGTAIGSITFSNSFAVVSGPSYIETTSGLFSGTIIGRRFLSEGNGLIQTFGGGVDVLPGTIPGITQNGGVYG